MTIDDLVKYYYGKKIERTFAGQEGVKTFLLRHPRLEKCRDELVKNIKLTELKSGIRLTSENIKGLAEDFGMMFAKVVLNQKEYEISSASEKLRRHKEQDKHDAIMDALDASKRGEDDDDLPRDA